MQRLDRLTNQVAHFPMRGKPAEKNVEIFQYAFRGF